MSCFYRTHVRHKFEMLPLQLRLSTSNILWFTVQSFFLNMYSKVIRLSTKEMIHFPLLKSSCCVLGEGGGWLHFTLFSAQTHRDLDSALFSLAFLGSGPKHQDVLTHHPCSSTSVQEKKRQDSKGQRKMGMREAVPVTKTWVHFLSGQKWWILVYSSYYSVTLSCLIKYFHMQRAEFWNILYNKAVLYRNNLEF